MSLLKLARLSDVKMNHCKADADAKKRTRRPSADGLEPARIGERELRLLISDGRSPCQQAAVVVLLKPFRARKDNARSQRRGFTSFLRCH
jgi:hypothetical protein